MKLVFATHNKNKFLEVQTMMPPDIDLLSLSDIDCNEDIAETETTIEGNAILKATYVKEHYGYDCFADDTGLEVNSLNNEPGVYSARYAGPDNNANAKTTAPTHTNTANTRNSGHTTTNTNNTVLTPRSESVQ